MPAKRTCVTELCNCCSRLALILLSPLCTLVARKEEDTAVTRSLRRLCQFSMLSILQLKESNQNTTAPLHAYVLRYRRLLQFCLSPVWTHQELLVRAWLSGLHVPTLLLPWAAAIGLCFGLCVKYGLWLAYGAIPPSSLTEVVVILDYFLFICLNGSVCLL